MSRDSPVLESAVGSLFIEGAISEGHEWVFRFTADCSPCGEWGEIITDVGSGDIGGLHFPCAVSNFGEQSFPGAFLSTPR